MALITCPECGKQISDKSKICINCGFPVQEIKNENAYRIVLEGKRSTWKYNSCDKIAEILGIWSLDLSRMIDMGGNLLCDGLSEENAKYILPKIENEGYYARIEKSNSSQDEEKNTRFNDMRLGIVRCPKCKSTAITTGQRGYKITTGFLGSSKTVNRCSSCGYSWEPKKIT